MVIQLDKQPQRPLPKYAMHELLLFGQVPAARHNQVLNVLAGIAAMQPQPILEKHLVFKPNRKPGSGTQKQVGGAQDIQKARAQESQAQELFYMQLVADIHEEAKNDGDEEMGDIILNGDGGIEFGVAEPSSQLPLSTGYGLASLHPNNPNTTAPSPSPSTPNKENWTLQFRDLPEVARQRAVTSRLMTDTPLTSGNPLTFMTALDYTHTKTYLLTGHRYTHLSTSLLLYRLLIPTTASTTSTNISPSTTRLLDPSGTYILQAAVRVQDGSKVETMTKAAGELLGLKETLRGCVEMEIGDRLALDTRVR